MKTIRNLLFLSGIIIFIACRCEKGEDDSMPIEFKLRVLNEQGQETTIFNEGENVIFSFLVINNSSETFYLENFFPNDDFFRVYQPNTSEGTLNYGIPYDGVSYIGYFPVPANGLLEFKCPWVSSSNIDYYGDWLLIDQELHETMLPKGNFHTGFSQTFAFPNMQSVKKHFEIKFTIK